MNEGLFAFSFSLNMKSDEKNAEREKKKVLDKAGFRTGKELI